jgi:hypothetical protein
VQTVERTFIEVDNVSVEGIYKIDLNHYWIGLFKARLFDLTLGG